jgi:CRISPR/Cas system-associated exonuclease Cas4 (RecB family)
VSYKTLNFLGYCHRRTAVQYVMLCSQALLNGSMDSSYDYCKVESWVMMASSVAEVMGNSITADRSSVSSV